MEDKVALVTGSNRGIGRDIALRLAEKISGVAIHYKSNHAAAEDVVRNISEKGKDSGAFCADLTREDEAKYLIKEVEKKFGKIDILVNNFGPILVKAWKDLTTSEWNTILQGNLFSAMYCMTGVLPGMRKRGWGRIINMGYSRSEQLAAYPTIAPYAVAKTGLLILTRTAATTEAEAGITVNMVSPGLMENGGLPQDKHVPRGRLGRFQDVSHAVMFLASPEADFITGNNLVVAGGWKL
jgi:3-oxoacyl-[acyl-carrier protein] reductase